MPIFGSCNKSSELQFGGSAFTAICLKIPRRSPRQFPHTHDPAQPHQTASLEATLCSDPRESDIVAKTVVLFKRNRPGMSLKARKCRRRKKVKNELYESEDKTKVFIIYNSYCVSNSILVTNILLDSIISYMRISGLSQWGMKNCKTTSAKGRSHHTNTKFKKGRRKPLLKD